MILLSNAQETKALESPESVPEPPLRDMDSSTTSPAGVILPDYAPLD